jgi:opacity protein-like surface antigen
MAKEGTQLGATIGLGAILFKTSIDAEAGFGGATAEYSRERSLTGPIGSIGLFGRFRSGSAWYFEADARALWIGIDRFDVYVADLGGSIRYFPWTNVGFEAGYQYNGVRLDVSQVEGRPNSLQGRIKYNFQNVRLGIVYTP